jgi:hypothetical protein
MPSQVHGQETSELGWEYDEEHRTAPPGLVDSAMLLARSAQLTWEGAVCLLFSTSPRDVWDRLVRAGREWEDANTPVSKDRERHRAERP